MLKIISAILNLQSIFVSLIPFQERVPGLGRQISAGLFFRSSLTGWEWHQGQLEITFLDTLWVMAALATIVAVLIYAARNVRRKSLVVGMGAGTTALIALDFGMILFGNFLNIFIQLTGWFGPTLARLLIG